MSKLKLFGTTSHSFIQAAPTSSGETFTLPGEGASNPGLGGMYLSTPQPTTSGNSVTFTDVPVWAKKINIMFSGVSLSGTDNFEIQLGTSSGYATANYNSTTQSEAGTDDNGTTSILIRNSNAAYQYYGQIEILKFSDDVYVWNGSTRGASGVGFHAYGGVTGISTFGTVDRFKIFPAGANTFDAGEINVLYQG